MADSPYIFDSVAREDFASVVLENSRRVPVLVDFWAAWCAPCRMLMPLLARLAEEYQGKFLLAKVNTDEQQQLAMEYGVRSLPTVKLFKDGRIVDELIGAQPESVIRAMIDPHIARESDQVREQALEARRRGDTATALRLLQEAAEQDPGNHRLKLALADILMDSGALDQARQVLESLPADVRAETEAKALLGRLEFADAVRDAPDLDALTRTVENEPDNSEARYHLAARKVLAGDYEGALETLLVLLQRDRGFRDETPRKAMLAVFDLLGGSGELVSRYRSRMFNVLH